MVPVSLYDEIHIFAKSAREVCGSSSKLTVTCDNPAVPSDEGNIVFRAANLIIEENSIRERVEIHIKKTNSHWGRIGRRQFRCGGDAHCNEFSLWAQLLYAAA